ncbi:MAG TPA: HAMP domain-containing sensor histidine kinase [Anaerohalosphaeraceae bacterium]|mgnify:CR=1 FL=1|nr:HAMP domain-containing sensor histidine kinase [Anaerohalosphaeraceae bacterium]HOL30547.1 HAMP domain-containing sensor histidine kinase [Anaerohalosphaeraceae bacterium]HOM75201.1 HAMP domain-containing sensor histidine kinase [Anaerohalosphaeraceae bacterium]HPC64005.1 HAMP domain-containing sensor histidine kinase [Anaerohalosphaeraceae bacterium]HPO70962.1 HAMP domain-containing sensor histidine kinase [Anaerohalosphaeraceae bacterium]
MLAELKRYCLRLRTAVYRKPLTLAEKCRLQFGGAVLFSLVLALLIPYFWMNKLTEKSALDAGRAITQAVYENHFRWTALDPQQLPRLSEVGEAITGAQPVIRWLRFDNEGRIPAEEASESERQRLELLLKDASISDIAWTERTAEGGFKNHYLRLVLADENCLRCHFEQGPAPVFSKNQEIGLLIARTTAQGLAWTLFMNRLWVVVAGLLAATGAMVAFYAITQRVILSPIRQLRALVNNIAEGNYDIRSAIKTGDEYERLSDAFNHMLDNLMESQHKLEKANQQLDAKISQLSEKNIELFKANKLKSEFLANMSHEFRTPLNAILGFAELIREKPQAEEEKVRRWAENIISSGRSLLNMINDLLDLAKAEAGKMSLHIEKTSIPQLLETLTAFFSPLSEQKKIQVDLEIDPQLPLVQTDPHKVQQILYNLLSNAIKFTPEGGRVRISAAMPETAIVRISISDTGPGISPQDQTYIFEKFHQLDGSITRKGEGTGLGLAICRQLADLLAASIHLESEVGKGSTFSLDLPVNLKAKQEQPAEASSQTSG